MNQACAFIEQKLARLQIDLMYFAENIFQKKGPWRFECGVNTNGGTDNMGVRSIDMVEQVAPTLLDPKTITRGFSQRHS